MSFGIHFNSSVARAQSSLAYATRELGTSFERLATGKQINRASDDPSGMIAGEQLEVQERILQRQIEAYERNATYMGAREGALGGLQDLMQEFTSLLVSVSNTSGTSPEEKAAMQGQADSLLDAIDMLSQTYTFNGQHVLESYTTKRIGVVTSGRDNTEYSLKDLASGGKFNLITGDHETAQRIVDSANSFLSQERARIGTAMLDNESKMRVSMTELESVSAEKSRIMDTDFGKETANLVRNQVLQQASMYTQMMAQKQRSDVILNLLSGAMSSAQSSSLLAL